MLLEDSLCLGTTVILFHVCNIIANVAELGLFRSYLSLARMHTVFEAIFHEWINILLNLLIKRCIRLTPLLELGARALVPLEV